MFEEDQKGLNERNFLYNDKYEVDENIGAWNIVSTMETPRTVPITIPGAATPKRNRLSPEGELLEFEPVGEIQEGIDEEMGKEETETGEEEYTKGDDEEGATQDTEEIDKEAILLKIKTYDTSLHNLFLLIILAMADYYNNSVDRCRLVRSLDPERYQECKELPDTWPLRILMNLTVIRIICYFGNLSWIANDTSPTPSTSRALCGSGFTMIAALLKFINLVCEKKLASEADNTEATKKSKK